MSNAAFQTYPQTHRSFELQKMSVERCKAEFADCFHHKQQLAKESAELAKRLKKGVELIQWIKSSGVTLNAEQNKDFKAFRNGANYLIHQLEDLEKHIELVEKGEFKPTQYPNSQTKAKNQQKANREDLDNE